MCEPVPFAANAPLTARSLGASAHNHTRLTLASYIKSSTRPQAFQAYPGPYPPAGSLAVTATRVQVVSSVLRTPVQRHISPPSRYTVHCAALSTASATPNTRNCDPPSSPKVCQERTKRGTQCTRPRDRVKSFILEAGLRCNTSCPRVGSACSMWLIACWQQLTWRSIRTAILLACGFDGVDRGERVLTH